MKTLFLQIIVALALASVAGGQTEKELAEVREKLEAFEKGAITLEELTDKEEWGRRLVVYYRSQSNAVTAKMKLPISRSFAAYKKYPEAAQLATEYVAVYSNDWRGWRILSAVNDLMEKPDKALAAGTNAVRLGDEKSVAPVAFVALKLDRLDIVQALVPRLLALKKSKQIRDPLEAVRALVAYSVIADREDVFVQALEGVDMKVFLSRDDDVPKVVRAGCAKFKSKEVEKICREVQAK